MPTNITIIGIPDEVYEKLKRQAGLNHRSINSEVIITLKKAVQSRPADPKRMIDRAKKPKSKAKGSLTMDQIQNAFDQGRP